jgi:hypothetical protein
MFWARTPPLLNRAWVVPLWVFGFTLLRLVRAMVADAVAGAAAPVPERRHRTSEVGAEWARPHQSERTRVVPVRARARAPSSSECGMSGTHSSSTEAGES